MKENLIHRLQSLTGESNLQFKRWDTLINLYVLPKIAGQPGREYISDEFLSLVADYGAEICAKNSYIGAAILEICLQRLSNGTIPGHCYPVYLEDLPVEYREYSSAKDKPHPMTCGCINFLMTGIELALYYSETKKHAVAILLSLVEQISPTGKTSSQAELGEYKSFAAGLFAHAKGILEKHLSFEDLYSHYAKPTQWKKHVDWLSKNRHLINWDQFFKDVNIAQQGNFYNRWLEKRRTKKFVLKN